MAEFLDGYFSDGLPLDQLSGLARDGSSSRFMGSSECQALVQSAFQRAAEAKLASSSNSLEVEKKLLAALAAVRSEFGLPRTISERGLEGRAGVERPFLSTVLRGHLAPARHARARFANLEWIRLVRGAQRYCRGKDYLSKPIGLMKEIEAFADRYGLLIDEDALGWIWPSKLVGGPILFERANAQLHHISDKRSPAWMALGAARRFTNADQGRAALNAPAGALASIVVASCNLSYTPQLACSSG